MMIHGNLNPEFFERIDCFAKGSELIESYGSVFPYSTLVLFSRKTVTPLAALTLTTDDPACLNMFTSRAAPQVASESYFQGMLNTADKAFDFTISNLSNRGKINFNILHTPSRLSATDSGPSYGINEINELSPNESCTIKADQRSNRRMVLKGRNRREDGPHTSFQEKRVPLTVEDSEQSAVFCGLYFFLSVAPDASCPTLLDKFAEGTEWKATPGFVRILNVSPQERSVRSQIWQRERPRRSFDSLEDALLNHPGPSRPRKPTCPLRLASMRSLDADGFFETTRSVTKRSGRQRLQKQLPGLIPIDPTPPRNPDVGHTQAAALSYGESTQTKSYCTTTEYDFEKVSEPTVLCMSIWEDMKLLPINFLALEESLMEQIQAYIQDARKNTIDSLDATSSDVLYRCIVDCVSPADTIICPCGHQCLNHRNVNIREMRNCPLCRSPISAFIGVGRSIE